MEIPTRKHTLAAATRRHLLSTISLIALKVALAVITAIAVTIALGTGSLWRTIRAVHTDNFGTNTKATST